ncbi:Oidioi.mRNA.OKI2018_I69.PAR.g10937.t1.cds [Oikopleura dioica]|uniref:Oidioi.mRNA.OKI2018_I69.PAR.g10937.t1.cds n=1 Tax=Oikopleura dioica TaxID=34765 RepID=A0ABN7RTH3_OIKDI|nr:Oidioi.mRNA.OKI2018_I69.PAR.g10937.t1.cds [Oikopleura dioica]
MGEQIDAQIDAVVHIENSVYLRSKSITNDQLSLKHFLDYAISLLCFPKFVDQDYELQIKQNNTGIFYGIVTFADSQVAQMLIEDHPICFKEDHIFITSAYLQPRRNISSWKQNNAKRTSPPRVSSYNSSHNRQSRLMPSSYPAPISPPTPTRAQPKPISPPSSAASSWQMPKPRFADNLSDLSRRLDQIKLDQFAPKIEVHRKPDLFDSGNSSPDDFSFNSFARSKPHRRDDQIFSFRSQMEPELSYPFGSARLHFPNPNLLSFSRSSSFNDEDESFDRLFAPPAESLTLFN